MMNRKIDLKYSVKKLPDEMVIRLLNEIKGKINMNDDTRELMCIKCCNLHVLNILKPIILEICDCLVLGSYQAALTLTNHLFENSLKQTLIIWDSGGKQLCEKQDVDKTFSEEVDRYDKKDMEYNINICKSKGLISKEEAKELVKFKNTYRNPFSHASYSKIFKDASTTLYMPGYGNIIKKETVHIYKVPFLSLLAQKGFATQNAKYYFYMVYEFIDKMDKKLLDLYPEVKKLVLEQKI